MVCVEVQNKSYFLEMDLGSKFQLVLDKHILSKLNKKISETLSGRDFRGHSYETKGYSIPLIKMGNISFTDVLVKEENDDFVKNTTCWVDPNTSHLPSNRIGSIGRALLERRNLLLDFYNSTVFISNDVKKLHVDGYNLEEFDRCSFEMGRTGIIVVANTDMGKIRLSLDTGATTSCIRPSFLPNLISEKKKCGLPCVTTSKFEIGGTDFGNVDLCFLDITPELSEIDGILGMNFLDNHVVYIDYENKVLYVKKAVKKSK